uniref:DDE Tnp4 domain-containing protein n=1 Tax=Scophthalmus maximus TaxID=52904 RepID=A0A8D3DUQ9_SCOMX
KPSTKVLKGPILVPIDKINHNQLTGQTNRKPKESFFLFFHELGNVIGYSITCNSAKHRTVQHRSVFRIAPRRRLAIVLWWLATPGEYHAISCLFGVGLLTVCMLVRQVRNALVHTLYQRFISLPTGLQRYPQCTGAIDGTHIPIIAPRDNPADCYNRKVWHLIVLQAVVDHNFLVNVYIGWPGRTHDARVLANSDLFITAEERQNGYLFPREIPVHIIGDAASPLKQWLMKGFTQHLQLSQEQAHFTHTLRRWRCLMKRNDIVLSVMPNVVAACCILHIVFLEKRPNTAQLIHTTITANMTALLPVSVFMLTPQIRLPTIVTKVDT